MNTKQSSMTFFLVACMFLNFGFSKAGLSSNLINTARSISTLTMVSVDSSGIQGDNASISSGQSVSSDGRYVVFNSLADNLVSDDTNNTSDVFLHDTQLGTTTRISVSSTGTEADADSDYASISADGRYVVFESWADNLVNGDTNGRYDVFLRDTLMGTTTRVSVASDGSEGNAGSFDPSISADGRFVVFESEASNLVAGDTNGSSDIFMHNIQTGETTLISVSSKGVQANDYSYFPVMSADGRYVAFYSAASNLVRKDTNGRYDVFVHDNRTGNTSLVSVNSSGREGNADSRDPVISADGRFIAFSSQATNLVKNDTNEASDIFLHDMKTGKTTLISMDSNKIQGNDSSTYPAISANGRFVGFLSDATNLVSGDTNDYQDAFIHDTQTGVTKIVSVSATGQEGSKASLFMSFSSNGEYFVLNSSADNLVSGDNNNTGDVFIAPVPAFN